MRRETAGVAKLHPAPSKVIQSKLIQQLIHSRDNLHARQPLRVRTISSPERLASDNTACIKKIEKSDMKRLVWRGNCNHKLQTHVEKLCHSSAMRIDICSHDGYLLLLQAKVFCKKG